MKKISDYTIGSWWAVLVFAIIVAIGLIFCSCSSNSEEHQPAERILIMDSSYPVYYVTEDIEGFCYTAQRINNLQVIDYYSVLLYEPGDTIMVQLITHSSANESISNNLKIFLLVIIFMFFGVFVLDYDRIITLINAMKKTPNYDRIITLTVICAMFVLLTIMHIAIKALS